MSKLHSSRVKCRGPRPEASAIPVVAWGSSAEVHLSGDFADPTDGAWIRLSVVRVASPKDRIEIEPASEEPLILKISSNDRECLHRVAFFIAMESRGRIV